MGKNKEIDLDIQEGAIKALSDTFAKLGCDPAWSIDDRWDEQWTKFALYMSLDINMRDDIKNKRDYENYVTHIASKVRMLLYMSSNALPLGKCFTPEGHEAVLDTCIELAKILIEKFWDRKESDYAA